MSKTYVTWFAVKFISYDNPTEILQKCSHLHRNVKLKHIWAMECQPQPLWHNAVFMFYMDIWIYIYIYIDIHEHIPALCGCVAAACGASAPSKKHPLILLSTYIVNVADFH